MATRYCRLQGLCKYMLYKEQNYKLANPLPHIFKMLPSYIVIIFAFQLLPQRENMIDTEQSVNYDNAVTPKHRHNCVMCRPGIHATVAISLYHIGFNRRNMNKNIYFKAIAYFAGA